MSGIIAVNYPYMTDERLAKIKAAAHGFKVVGDDALSECEIFFGDINADKLCRAKKLKWFHSASAGVDRYLAPGVLASSVILTGSAGMYNIAISEHLLGFTIMLMRQLHSYQKLQTQHKWGHLGSAKSIYQSLITVVGLGGIGGRYAASCKALGATVRGVVRKPRSIIPDCVDALFTAHQLDEAIVGADVVALTLPGTAETVKLFDKNRMLKMKKGSYILNVGRGSAIEQDALIELLENGHLGGAGLDVTAPEPLPNNSKLWDLPNVILTPHSSGKDNLPVTSELIFNRFIDYLRDYIAGRPFKQVVDREAGY